MTEPEPKVEAINRDRLAEGRREWTDEQIDRAATAIYNSKQADRHPDAWERCRLEARAALAEVGVSPEEEHVDHEKLKELADLSTSPDNGLDKNNDGCPWCGRFGLSREEIEALIAAVYWAVEDWRRDLLHGDESGLGRPRVEAAESARAKLRAYLGGTDG